MSDTRLDAFVTLSAALTGIAADKLHPALDTHGTAAEYLAYLDANAPTQIAALEAAQTAAGNLTGDALAQAVLQGSNGANALAAQSLMLMWYLGAYYAPADLQAYQASGGTSFLPFIVVSMDAYTQGWAWRVAQAHPMGYSDLRFGYWTSPPPPLSAFVGGAA